MGLDLRRSLTLRPRLFTLPRVPPISSIRSPRHARALRKTRDESTRVPGEETPAPAVDLEAQLTTEPTNITAARNDVYNLLSGYKSPLELSQIRPDTISRAPDRPGPNQHHIPCYRSTFHARRLRRFYEEQNSTIERMLKTVEEHRADARRSVGAEALHFKLAVYGSLSANIVLSALQVFAAVTSGSLSLITTMADAVFDPLSNLMLILSNRATHRVDPRKFPAGRARLETAGNIFFCFIMIAVSVLIIAFSIRELSSRWGSDEVNGFHLPSIIAAAVSFATKMVLFIYCYPLRKRYSQVYIVWQDHRNDLFINGFGILTSIGGSRLIWWVDPLGAIVLSAGIIVLWLRTAWAEFMLLVGIAAPVGMQQLITYISLTHSASIIGIDTVRVYHSGPRLIAEVDVVMDRDVALADAHNTAEALQFKLESLPNIERSYVHVDYETTHKPEHAYVPDV